MAGLYDLEELMTLVKALKNPNNEFDYEHKMQMVLEITEMNLVLSKFLAHRGQNDE